MDCTFCRILRGELSSSRVFEDLNTVAFLDIHPVSDGHTLVIPKRHVESFTDLTPEECAQLISSGQIVAEHLKKALDGCDINLSLADGANAGQEVPHVHLHIIPRKKGDGFGWKFPPGYSEEAKSRNELDLVAERVRDSIKRVEKSE